MEERSIEEIINSGDLDSNGTPGFEIIFFMMAVVFVVTLFKRVKF